MQPDYLTVGQARELLGVSKHKMADLIKTGIIEAEIDTLDKRQKLVRRSDVEALVKRCPAAA